MLIVN